MDPVQGSYRVPEEGLITEFHKEGRMAKKNSSPVLWFLVSFVLGAVAVRFAYTYTEPPDAVVPAASVSAPAPSSPAPILFPYDWPIVRWLDQIAGEWTNDDGVKVTLTAKRVKKTRDWLIIFSGLPRSNSGDGMTCEISPELKDGGFNAVCNGYNQEQDLPVFFRFHMNLERKLHVECPLFGVTVKAKGAQ